MVDAGTVGVLAPTAGTADSSISRDAYRAALTAFATVAEALGDFSDLDGLLHLIAMRLSELAGVQRCSVFLRDDETALFRGQVAHPCQVGDERIKRLVAGVQADRFTREVVQSKRPVVISNALEDPRPVRSTIREFHIRSVLGVPMVLRGAVIGIVFLDTEDERHAFSASVCEIASTFADLAAVAISQARMTAELRASVAMIAQKNQLLRQAAAVDDRLTSLVLDGGDLREIATAVAELTGKPAAIHDAQHHRLAAAVPPWFDDEVLPRLLKSEYRTHPLVAEALAGLSDTQGGIIGPLPTAGLPQRFLVAPVTMRNEDCGCLVIMEYGSRFRALDLHIARRAATNVALELAAERRAAAAEWDARASLTADLIRGTRDAPSLERRAHYLGIDLSAPRLVCLVTSDPSTIESIPPAETIAAALAGCADGAGVLSAGVAEGVVALLELEGDLSTLEATAHARGVAERALAALDRSALSAAISTRCIEPADYVRAYAEARQVMTCLRSLARERSMHVLTADDLGPGRLILASSNRAEARRFSHDALGALLGDDEGTRDLLRTLQVFFDSGRSVRRSALALGVHENTIRYRLARIEEATALAVATSSDDQLSAQLALLVLRLDGALPA